MNHEKSLKRIILIISVDEIGLEVKLAQEIILLGGCELKAMEICNLKHFLIHSTFLALPFFVLLSSRFVCVLSLKCKILCTSR